MSRPDRSSLASNIDYKDVVDLDNRLGEMNLRRQSVPNDGNCFYYAIEDQLAHLGKGVSHYDIRMNCVNLLREKSTLAGVTWSRLIESGLGERQYLQKHSIDGTWADHVMTQAAASATGYVINIVTRDETVQVRPDGGRNNGDIWLGRLNGQTYVSLRKERGRDVKNLEPVQVFNLSEHLKQSGGILKQTNSPTTNSPLYSISECCYNFKVFLFDASIRHIVLSLGECVCILTCNDL